LAAELVATASPAKIARRDAAAMTLVRFIEGNMATLALW
jgi:hypothetical protein